MNTIKHRNIGTKRTSGYTKARNKSFRRESKVQLLNELLEDE